MPARNALTCVLGERWLMDVGGGVQDVLKDLAKMCDTQDGSRQVQALLTSATPNEVTTHPLHTR